MKYKIYSQIIFKDGKKSKIFKSRGNYNAKSLTTAKMNVTKSNNQWNRGRHGYKIITSKIIPENQSKHEKRSIKRNNSPFGYNPYW